MNTAMQTPALRSVDAALAPADAALAPNPDLDIDGALAHAESFLDAGLVSAAAEIFEALLEVEGLGDLFQARHGLARCAFARGELHAALGHLQLLMQQDGTSAEVNNDLGVVYYRLGLLDLAKEQLERAVMLAPDDGLALRNLVDVAYACGDLDTCAEAAETLLTRERNAEVAQILDIVRAEQNKP